LRLDDGKTVKVKPENVAIHSEPVAANAIQGSLADDDDDSDEGDQKEGDVDTSAADESAAFDSAANMAAGNVRHGPPPATDPNVDGFTASVCIDPSLLPKKATEDDEPERKRESSRSRKRRLEDKANEIKKRLAADKGPRPGWCVPSPEAVTVPVGPVAGASAGNSTAAGGTMLKEPEESREELMKMSVGKLKELLKEFGKTARGCLEKRDFVDRLKPAPKSS